jgi:hypothetical protein
MAEVGEETEVRASEPQGVGDSDQRNRITEVGKRAEM